MNNRLVKKVLATMLAATLLAMPIVAGATDQPAKADGPKAISTFSAGGSVIKNEAPGTVLIPESSKIAGLAVRESVADIKAAAGLGKSETPFVKAYEITAKSSPAAYASFQGCAAATGGTVVDAINIDLGKMAGGKFTDLSEDVTVPMTIGVKGANGQTLKVAMVSPGGATALLEDTDDNPNTVTFPLKGGLAAYALLAYE